MKKGTVSNLEQYLREHIQSQPSDGGKLLRDVAYERLRDAFRYANLEAGEPISEVKISKVLGISRTPVREALHQLALEGLVDIIPGRAVMVASRSVKDVIDVVYIRLLLEPELVRLTTETITKKQINDLEQTMQLMEKAAQQGDKPSWLMNSRRFFNFSHLLCKLSPPVLGRLTTLL